MANDNNNEIKRLLIDLREFGFGIREVNVLKVISGPVTDVGPDSIGTEEIKNDSVEMEDLHPDVRAAIEEKYEFATDDDVKAVLGLG